MATYYADTYLGPNAFTQEPHCGARTIVGKVTIPLATAPATGDVLKLFRVGSGTFIRKVYLWNNDWGTTVPIAKLGLASLDDDAIIENSTNTFALGTAHATEPVVYVQDGATSAGTIAETKFVAKLVATTSDDTFQVTLGSTSGGDTTAEKYLIFAVDIIDISGARSGDVAFNYNGYSSL